jgi:protein-S-isoprenylcysteine O-methyltransferase Ste14
MVETVTNWLVIVGVVILLGVIVGSWLASYRVPKAAPVGAGKWMFTLPAWVQIGAGLAACVLFAYLGYVLWIPLPLIVPPNVSVILRLVGLALFLAGWLLVFWARWTLGAVYGVSTSFAVQLRERHQLIQLGPYAFVRHPMYLGCWLLLAGVTLVYGTWTPLVFLVMCVPSFYRRARREEAALASAFSAEWQRYAARTKFMIPFVY